MRSDFKTDRLILTALTGEHAPFILELLNSDGWLRFIEDRGVHTGEDARAYIEKISQNPAIKYWVAAIDQTREPIGIISFIQRDYLDFPDLGFAFLPEFAGKSYAFEAATAVMNYLREEKFCDHLLVVTIPENTTSIHLLKRLGFVFERTLAIDGHEKLVYGFDFV